MNKQIEDVGDLSDFLQSLDDTEKKKLPVSMFGVKAIGSGILLIDKSKDHNTKAMPCYFFYKPISQTYKSFDDE
jgi:hypothetical protein